MYKNMWTIYIGGSIAILSNSKKWGVLPIISKTVDGSLHVLE
jgi:hypothetical protein